MTEPSTEELKRRLLTRFKIELEESKKKKTSNREWRDIV